MTEAVVEQGFVTNVTTHTLGAYLAADAALAAVSITVDSILDFLEGGGSVTLNGVTYTYTSADYDTNIIAIPAGLSAAAVAGDRVEVTPVVVEKEASVMVPHAEDALSVRVPHQLFALVPDGVRLSGGELVQFAEQNNQFVMTDVLGKVPVMDGTMIDPATLPPNPSDGIPPSSSPTPTAEGGVGFAHIRWSPVLNQDLVTYLLYGDTTTGFTPGPGNLLTETPATSYTHRPVPALYPPTTYFYRLIATDADGAAAVSAEVSTQLVQATNDDISAEYGYFGDVSVDQLTAGTLNADVALASKISTRLDGTGPGVDLDTTGQVIYDPAGTPATVLTPENSKFKGEGEFNGLTVTGSAAFRTTAEISRGAVMTLQQGTTAAQSPPSVVVGWPDPVVVPTFAGNYGLVWTGSEWATVNSDAATIKRSSSGDIALSGGVSTLTWGGLTRIGTDWYTLGITNDGTGIYYVSRYNSSGAAVVQVAYTPIAGVNGSGGSTLLRLAPAAIGNDGTNVLVAEFDDANNRFRIQTRNPTTLVVSSTLNTGANAGFSGPVVGIRSGSFDFGSTRFVVLSKNGQHFWPFDASGVYQPNDAWAAPVPGSMSGFDWDGTRFWSTRAKNIAANPWIYKHTTNKWSGADPLTYLATSTWRDTDATGGTHETDMGPVGSFPMKKRAAVTLTSPTIPDAGGTDDPNAVSFYLSNTTAARTAMWRQTLPADGVNTVVVGDAITFAGTNPPASNNFPGATPAVFQSAAVAGDSLPYTGFYGDGTGRGMELVIGQHKTKTSDQGNSTITMANATDLSVPVVANGIYDFEVTLFFTASSSTANTRVGWSLPSGSFNMFGMGPGQGETSQTSCNACFQSLVGATNQTAVFGSPAVGSIPYNVFLKGKLVISTTPGTANFQFAEGTASATVTMKTGSQLYIRRVG